MVDFRRLHWPGMVIKVSREGHSISTDMLRTRVADPAWAWTSAVTIPAMLLAPALWNGYPLLQWDTGGYLARWYEGYLVPSRSTVFGLYLHFGERSSFWLNLGIQALTTLWILQLTLRVFGIVGPVRIFGLALALVVTTALPWLASMLLTDIFAGLSILSLFLLVLHDDKISRFEDFRCLCSPRLLARPTAPHWRCCSGSAAQAGLRGHSCAGGLRLRRWRAPA